MRSFADFAPFCQNGCKKNEPRKSPHNTAKYGISGRKNDAMKIMFVCHGNICRSPMGEFILKDLLQKEYLIGHTVASSAVSREEIGNPVYPSTRLPAASLPSTAFPATCIMQGSSPVRNMTSMTCFLSWMVPTCAC